MDFRAIFAVIGALTTALGATMLIPAAVDAMAANEDWLVFVFSALVTIVVGSGVWASSRRDETPQLNLRQAFLMTTLIWVVLTGFGALPLALSELRLSPTDAVFEAMSGITTTGATVIVGLDSAPPGILLWRGMLQWFGGLGIVVVAVAVLPMLRVGGMQMFRAEAFETPDRLLPRAAQIAAAMTIIYAALTLACAVLYWIHGMTLFDAVTHALSTVATGGFSTRDASLGGFDNPAIHYTAAVFMILGALPFILYLGLVQGRISHFLGDSQVRLFLILIAIATGLVYWTQVTNSPHTGEEAFRYALFSVVSTMTGTGFTMIDYGAWGPFAVTLFFIIMFIGGCTGSTSCGIKIFRFQVLARDLAQHVRQIIYPSMIHIKRYNGRPLSDDVSTSVQTFVFVYFASFLVLAILLSMSGLDSLEAISGAATALTNVGPGLGEIIGPVGNFSSLSDIQKWLLTFGMLIGRLEVMVILVLFTPRFWRG